MHIYTKRTLREFWERYPAAADPLDEWHRAVQQARWTTPADVRSSYPDARILSNNRIVFRIRGNQYRLIVQVKYHQGEVYIRFVGTHAQYDRINALEV